MFVRVGPVAQRLEQRTHNPLVLGSNPSGPTNLTRDLRIYQTIPGLSAPPVVGLRNKVIEMNAPTHDPEAAKPTYIQFFV
jgi:hypothetical protein